MFDIHSRREDRMKDSLAMNRRMFLKRGAAGAASMMALSQPFLAAGSPKDGQLAEESEEVAYAIHNIQAYLRGYTPPEIVLRPGPFLLKYDILGWTGDAVNQNRDGGTNPQVGSLQIEIEKGNGDVTLSVEQEKLTNGNTRNVVDAEIVCNNDELYTLKSWRLNTHIVQGASSTVERFKSTETGTNTNGLIQVETAGWDGYEYQSAAPVTCPWSLISRAASWSHADFVPAEFSVMKNLTTLQPGHSLYNDGEAEIAIRDQTLSMRLFAQIGEGIHPRHYLIDSDNRPLFVTCGLLSLALKEISFEEQTAADKIWSSFASNPVEEKNPGNNIEAT